MGLRFGSDSLADVAFSAVTGGTAIGTYRLFCKLQFIFLPQPQREFPAVVQDLGGDLYVGETQQRMEYLGRVRQADQQTAFTASGFAHSREFRFGIELTNDQMNAIEALRNGGGISLRLFLSAIVSVQGRTDNPTETLVLDVPQGVWIDVLRAMEYRDIAILEIPRAGTSANPGLANAVGHLDAQRGHLRRGDWRATVAAARDVMESLDAMLGETDGPDGRFEPMYQSVRSAGRLDRIRNLRRALKLLAAPAKHADASSGSIEWTRGDALLAMHLSSALLSHCFEV